MNAARDAIESRLGRLEFTLMLSMIMAVTALATDMMLPAFGSMRPAFGLAEDSNSLAPAVTFFFLGLALGQSGWGPLSDALGRKRILYAGLVVYVVSSLAAALAPSLLLLFVFRFIGGLGAAGPRVVALSIVRDVYEGEAMARMMSYILAVFILIPVIAPSIGSLVLVFGNWHLVFIAIALFGAGLGVWSLRLPETLPEEHRIPLDMDKLLGAVRIVLSNRLTMGLTLARTAVFGFFASYLASSQLIIDQVLGLDEWFPVIFGGSASIIGIGMLANTRILDRIDLRRLVNLVGRAYVVATLWFFGIAWMTGGTPSLLLFLIGLAPILLCHALLIPNYAAAAMNPMGEIAGTAAAIMGTVSVFGGAVVGAFVDSLFNGTVIPLATSAVIGSSVALLLLLWANRHWSDEPAHAPAA